MPLPFNDEYCLLPIPGLPEYPSTCYDFVVQGYNGTFGHLIEPIVRSFTWSNKWEVDHEQRKVVLLGNDFEARRDNLRETLRAEKEKGTFKVLKKWTGEPLPIYGPERELVVEIERAASGLFGIATYGVQLITYCDDAEGLSIWAARRSVKQSPLPKQAGSDWTISYVTASETKTTSGGEAGLIRAEVQFVYDMKVDREVKPIPVLVPSSKAKRRLVSDLYSVEQIKKSHSRWRVHARNYLSDAGFALFGMG
ncbi:hypothetical protein H2200_000052 [Cladophialophora chaetospira]|uniref:Uncharacterized protein n=1 Tax=Cladophialophora chaetospira TaxID=386627 RepID=A0AA38XNS0_9EURO|nr:hypothetical protein H2200_000052 [Cladophialophora chaetospira]